MSPSLTFRRQADDFARAVEEPATAADAAERWAPLREVVTALRSTPEVTPREEFVGQLRESLMAEAEQVLVQTASERDVTASLQLPPRTPARRRRDRRLASVAVGCVLAGTTGSMALAAQSALPGEPLYPVKQGIETLQRITTFSEVAQGSELLEDATNRLHEVAQLSQQGIPATDPAIPRTLEDFVGLAQEGAGLLLTDYRETGSESSVVRVRSFVAESLDTLALLHDMVPARVQDALLSAAQALRAIDAQARDLCPGCGSMPAASVPEVLLDTTAGAADARVVDPSELVRTPATTDDGSRPSPDGASPTDRPELPDVDIPDPGQLPPASVTAPEKRAPGNGSAGTGERGETDRHTAQDTVTRLTDSLLTGGSSAVEDVVETGVDTVDGLTGPLLGVTLDGGDDSGTSLTEGLVGGLLGGGGQTSDETGGTDRTK